MSDYNFVSKGLRLIGLDKIKAKAVAQTVHSVVHDHEAHIIMCHIGQKKLISWFKKHNFSYHREAFMRQENLLHQLIESYTLLI